MRNGRVVMGQTAILEVEGGDRLKVYDCEDCKVTYNWEKDGKCPRCGKELKLRET